MRIVIDLQGAQSEDGRNRGIGRYSLSLAQAVVRNSGEHDIFIALNGLFPDTIEPIRAAFAKLLPQEHIRVWHAPGPVNQLSGDNTWLCQAAELVREAFLASLNPDMVLITSLFEGCHDNVVTSVGALSREIPTAIVLYDLIQLLNRIPYLENPVIAEWYEGKIGHLSRANLLLSISESSRQDAINYLGFPADQIANISTAVDTQFCQKTIAGAQQQELMQRYGISGHYVMYTGGIDHRKNIEGLIRAYASLPVGLRKQHQLAVICSIQDADRARLELLAKEMGLAKAELILTGFVPEDDLVGLYNLCKVFVFPSKYEGFGLPALEAMCCGRAVIGANTSSLPEVIGNEEALFDPRDDGSITAKLEQVLVDGNFRQALEQHALVQAKKFSWDKTAQLALAACEKLNADSVSAKRHVNIPAQRPRLAYISPLPPERSGISSYSAELLPKLARHYEIDVVVAQASISDTWIKANCKVRTVEWFKVHAASYDRVLYHFGNSPFHQHMFELLEQFSGVVVLHEFFLSSIVAHMDFHRFRQGSWASELYHSHGYPALRHRFKASDSGDVVNKYPCNLGVLKNAQGVIVHSASSRRLAQHWYGPQADERWAEIPLLREPAHSDDLCRLEARKALGIAATDFVVCSFGLINPPKLNHRLLDAWLSSELAKDNRCKLLFVGEIEDGEYGKKLLEVISKSGIKKQVHITGWAETDVYRQYLAVADVGVQLRTQSRGETSAAVLDCMNYGLPTIVNANGSFADLPGEAVLKIADEFRDDELIAALERLWKDGSERQKRGQLAKKIIHLNHAPRFCADQYFKAIETFYRDATTAIPSLIKKISELEEPPQDTGLWKRLAQSIDESIPAVLPQKQLLLDISELVQRDVRSGIQRVVRSILHQRLIQPPEGVRVEPVYATLEHGYRYARRFTSEFLNCSASGLNDDPLEYKPGDIFLGLDLEHHVVAARQNFYQQLRRDGIKVQFIVYDLLPVLMPRHFGKGADELHIRWLEAIAKSDGAVCISKTVADELRTWLKERDYKRLRPFEISWFHLGADIGGPVHSCGMPDGANKVLSQVCDNTTFLMVGTIESRKGHSLTVAAFEQLWIENFNVNLVVVGKQGWMVETLIERVQNHPELGKRLIWLDGGISDEYLEKIYSSSDCLIAASEGEGFGLPLIEAAQHSLPIIARDIPVFREVAGEHAYYFSGDSAGALAKDLKDWLELYKNNRAPASKGMPWLTWKESAEHLLAVVCK